jgi:GTP-binding protein YchF
VIGGQIREDGEQLRIRSSFYENPPMECGIVGLPNVGKSTLFNALTAAGIEAQNYPFCTIEPNIGVVSVPDPRLNRINAHMPTEKIIPAVIRLVDIAGLVEGASKGEGLGNKFLANIREVDALLQVTRCFVDDDILHVSGSVDPVRDIEIIGLELLLADAEQVESTLDKARRQARSGDKDAKIRAGILERCKECIDDEQPIRSLEFTPDEQKIVRSFGFITAKPVLYVCNVDEGHADGSGQMVQDVRAYAEKTGGEVVVVCAKIESELSELDDSDKMEMLESLGMSEPALAVVARGSYGLLGLQSYFTAGPKEIRAWTIHQGFTAPKAAGVIHGDFERGFIRAECYSIEELEQFKNEKSIREAGKMRSEGKEYVIQDGDVVHFLFNV